MGHEGQYIKITCVYERKAPLPFEAKGKRPWKV